MKINYLTTDLSIASGGAIYDKNFYEVLKSVHPETRFYNDQYFVGKYKKGNGLLAFNGYYRKTIRQLLDCDYLVMNSRLYTRMMLFNIKKVKNEFPRTKLIVIHHHSNYMNNKGFRRIIHRLFEKRVLTTATELIIPNEYVIQQVKRDFGVQKIVCLPSSFDKKKYKISSLNSNILLFVGSVEYRKGLIYGIQAFNKIHKLYSNYEYHIAGAYDEKDDYYLQIKEYVEKNKLSKNVIFEGRVSNERLDWLYENAKLFLFPSLLEGYGCVMIEAMGRGVPVVAFDNTAMPYTIKDNKNGLLISDKNVNEMADRVCRLITDDVRMHEMQQEALGTYESVPSQRELNHMTKKYFESWS